MYYNIISVPLKRYPPIFSFHRIVKEQSSLVVAATPIRSTSFSVSLRNSCECCLRIFADLYCFRRVITSDWEFIHLSVCPLLLVGSHSPGSPGCLILPYYGNNCCWSLNQQDMNTLSRGGWCTLKMTWLTVWKEPEFLKTTSNKRRDKKTCHNKWQVKLW